MSDDPDAYARGLIDGLSMAETILADMEAAVLNRLDKGSKSMKTRDTRHTRAKAYEVARSRIATRLRTRTRSRGGDGIPAAVKRLGL